MSDDDRRVRRMLTVDQVLRMVPIGRSTLMRWERKGKFPRGRFLVGNRKVWFEKDIVDWQDERMNLPPGRRGGAP